MTNNKILIEIDRVNLAWSGVEKSLLSLRSLLIDMEYQVDVCARDKNNTAKLFENNINTISYEKIDYDEYEIIIVSVEGDDYLNFINKVGDSKAKIIKIVHGDPDLLVERYDYNYLKMYQYYNMADKLIYLNEIFLKGLPVDLLKKSLVIEHNMNFKMSTKISDSRKVIYLGRYDEPNKQVITVLESWNIVKENVPDAILEIYGDGPSKSFYNKMIKKDKLKGVYLYGKVEDVDSVLKDAKINVLLSKHEGLPLSILEGIDCGVAPLVSMKSQWTKDLIIDNFKDTSENKEGVAESIVKILNMDLMDYNLLVSLQQSLISGKMSRDIIRDKWNSLINELGDTVTEVSSRKLSPYFNNQIQTTNSESKLKKEYDALLAKYQYVLSLLAKSKK